MKNSSKFLLITGILLIVCLMCAGCSSSSGTTNPATSTPTAEITSTTATALYSAGDIVKSASASSGTAWLIMSYDPSADTYTRAFIYQNTDGTWGYLMNSDTSTSSRASLEKMYPVKVTSVSVSSVPVKSPTAVLTTVVSATTALKGTTATTATIVTVAPKPQFKDIIPDEGDAGSTVTVTDLVGSGFQSGASVQLTRSGSTSINATSVTLVSTSHMTCVFTIPSNAASGTWNIVITNPDGQSVTYANYFTVHASTSGSTTTTTTTVAGSSFSITSVSPSTVIGGATGWMGTLTITTSTAVQQGVTVTLSKSGSSSISVSYPQLSSSCTTLYPYINTPVSYGTWDVTVTNPDGTFGKLTGGLTVN